MAITNTGDWCHSMGTWAMFPQPLPMGTAMRLPQVVFSGRLTMNFMCCSSTCDIEYLQNNFTRRSLLVLLLVMLWSHKNSFELLEKKRSIKSNSSSQRWEGWLSQLEVLQIHCDWITSWKLSLISVLHPLFRFSYTSLSTASSTQVYPAKIGRVLFYSPCLFGKKLFIMQLALCKTNL